ncbi:MAG TPA: HAMP domain-containing sensor histidine kinase [Streptosporangiaceae bacterium]|nr:HAMP domain-containing sensor histidine kinase [Streptosporangiaceae bacterium]
MSGSSASPGRGLARLAALFSWRTISGKLIIGLALLFGVASVAVSVVTDHSLNQSLMASLNQQLQTATDTWYSCVLRSTSDPDHDTPRQAAYQPARPGYGMCSNGGQAPGTFELLLAGNSVDYKNTVKQPCRLSVPDQAVLVALPSDQGQSSSGEAGPGPPDLPPARTYIRTLSSLGGEFLLTKVAGPEHGTTLVTGLPLATVQGTLANVEDTQHVVYAAVLVLALALGTAMVQFSLRPLRRVAATATKVTELPLDSGKVTLPAGVPDSDPRTEVGRVGAAFNRMLFHVERALGRRAASEARLRRFAADASHELRTPLSAIRGYAELALRHPGPVPEDVAHALRRVESESARMTVLVDDLLLLARLDAGRPLEREPVDLSRLAIETTSDARVARGDHRWRLELPDEPVLVEGDEHRLHQVLANLLSNAGKHTPPGSTVSVALTLGEATASIEVPAGTAGTAIVQRGVAPPGPRVELSISDDGPGISAELLPELFERFTRGEAGRARDASAAGKSTGLGLAIVDAVVAAHGGAIVVTSHPGMTRFAILLPLLHEPAGQPQASPV